MKKIFALFSLAAALSVSCRREVAEPVRSQPDGDAVHQVPFSDRSCVPGVVFVKFERNFAESIENEVSKGGLPTKSDIASVRLKSTFEGLRVQSMERLFPYAGEYEERTRREGLHQWYVVHFGEDVSATKAGNELALISEVEISETVPKIRTRAIFNDPMYRQQWDFYNDGKLTSSHVQGCDINVVPVWEEYTKGDPKVIVSVVDGGIDYSHNDLAFNYVGGYNYVTRSNTVTAHEHGTHVAGTIAATNNNGIGVCGIAGGDFANRQRGVGLYSSQVFTDNSSAYSFATALKEGADKGAVISQNSWGYDFSEESNPYEAAKRARPETSLVNAINYFNKYAGCDNAGNQKADSPMKGGLTIFAAGNDSWDVDPICQYCDVVAVGGVAPNYNRAWYSNYGSWVDIAAPGGDSYVNYNKGPIYSTVPGNKYDWLQGTSMACPHVSGVAALVLSFCGGYGFTNEDLKEKLLNGAKYEYGSAGLAASNQIGPLLDAYGALKYGMSYPPDPVSDFTASVTANLLKFDFCVTADEDDGKASQYILMASESESAISKMAEGNSYNNPPSNVLVTLVSVGDKEVGDALSATILAPKFGTKYYMAIVARDQGGNFSSLSPIKNVTTLVNHPPVITPDVSGDIFVIKAHETLSLPFTVEDPDGQPLAITFDSGYRSSTISPVVTGSMKTDSGKFVVLFEGPKSNPGRYTLTIKASDSFTETIFTKDYEFLENHPPVKVKDIGNVFLEDPDAVTSFAVAPYFKDPDGEQLKLKFKASIADIVSASGVNVDEKIKILALAPGLTAMTVTASDAKGKSVSSTFKILVRNPEDPIHVPSLLPAGEGGLKISTGVADIVPTTVKIVSSTGQTVHESVTDVCGFDEFVIPVGNLAPGIYTVNVKSAGDETTKKFLKL